jgi:hypothetical protein
VVDPNVGEPSAPSSVDQSRNSHLLNTHRYQLTDASCFAAQYISLHTHRRFAFELGGRDHVIPSDPVVDVVHGDGWP